MKVRKTLLGLAATAALAISASFGASASTMSSNIADTPTVNDSTAKYSEAVAAVLSDALTRSLANVESLGVPVNRELVGKAIARVLAGEKLSLTPAEADRMIAQYLQANRPAMPVDTLSKASQQEFIAAAAKQPGAVVTPSGLVFQVITEGEGQMPTLQDTVVVRYAGKLSTGDVFDQTQPGEEVDFPVARLVKGFTEGLQMMKPGGTYRLVIPAELGYGPNGIPGDIPGNAALDFQVELLRVIRPASTNSK